MSEGTTFETSPTDSHRGLLSRWHSTPLYLRILGALILGVLAGVLLGPKAESLRIPSKLILQMLGALAPPLILVAVVQALMKANVRGRMGGRMVGLLILNTLVAIIVGLLVANVVQPGRWAKLTPPAEKAGHAASPGQVDILAQFLENVPKSLLGPLGDNGKIIGVILIAIAFGLALRRFKDHPVRTVEDVVEVAFGALLVILHWVIDVIPFGVFGIVAAIVGTEGFQPFLAMGAFIGAVILALLLQAAYYLTRIKFGSWVPPFRLLRETRDALVMAFSTASSTITMPVTFERLRKGVGLREESASMGSLVGSNFNNDGTALYEAMAALFISQMIGNDLTLTQQLMVVLTSVVASVGAAGIPEAGLVTMTLVFHSVGLPTQYIALLFTVDWFLDRCRTMINVMGDMNVSCLLDGKIPEDRTGEAEPA